MGRQSHWEATRKNAISGRHTDDARDRLHMLEHNEKVLARAKDANPPPLVDTTGVTVDDFMALPVAAEEPQTDFPMAQDFMSLEGLETQP